MRGATARAARGWGREGGQPQRGRGPHPWDYLAVGDVDRQINVPEGARPDLPYQFVFPSDNELGLGAAAARHPERRRWRLGPSPDTSEGRTEASEARARSEAAEEGGRKRKPSALSALQGPESAEASRSPPLSQASLARPQSVRRFFRLPGRATYFWAAAAASLSRRPRGPEKERGVLGQRYHCHRCRRLPPGGTSVTPLTPPSCYSGSSQHKMPPVPGSRFFTARSTLGKGSRALAPEGRQREGGRTRIRESRGPRSERHPGPAQPLMRTATLLTAQACRRLSLLPPPTPPGAHFHFRSLAVLLSLPVC